MATGVATVVVTVLAAMASEATAQTQAFRITRPKIEHAADVDFGKFATFAWKPSQDAGGDAAAHTAFVFDIERGLADAGLRRAGTADEAQLLVRYYTSFERRVRTTTTQERAIQPDNQRTSVGISRAIEGTLVIELYRASDERRVWKGSTSDTTAGERFTDEQIRRAVDLILGEYPPEGRAEPEGPH